MAPEGCPWTEQPRLDQTIWPMRSSGDQSALLDLFDEFKVGDKVSLTYNSNVSARLKPPGVAPVDTGGRPLLPGSRRDLAARQLRRER
jgi:hypothetical protein